MRDCRVMRTVSDCACHRETRAKCLACEVIVENQILIYHSHQMEKANPPFGECMYFTVTLKFSV